MLRAGERVKKKHIFAKTLTPKRGFSRPVVVGEYQIELNGHKTKFILKRSRVARLIWLKISPETGLTVTVPLRYNCENLPGYLTCRTGWIERNLEKYRSATPRPTSDGPNLPDKISFLGKSYVLKNSIDNGGFTAIALDTDVLNFNLAFGEPTLQGLKLWLKDQAGRLIYDKVDIFGHKIQVIPNKVYVRDQKSRWGSCSVRKNLSFNWRLIMVPEPVIDYVIIHELCHLKEMSHSKSFWKLVNVYCPEWRIHRKWLNEHCYELTTQLGGK